MLKNKVIIVTGAGSGIGRAASIILAKAGAKVLATDYVEAAVRETESLILEAGGVGKSMKVDVSKEAGVIAMVDFAVASFGRLDGAFNNAGVSAHTKRADEMTEADWDAVMDINVKGVFFCMKYETLAMRKTGGGAIVNTSSANGLIGNPQSAGYVASKHGVVGLTRGASCDAAVTGVRVNAVLPGVIRTPMVNALLDNPEMKAYIDATLSRHSVGRFGEPEDIGYAVKWLLSDEASFMNGAAICVDGGYTAR